MSNRKARRQATTGNTPQASYNIPLTQPDRNNRHSQTLLDLAAKRQAELDKDNTLRRPPRRDGADPIVQEVSWKSLFKQSNAGNGKSDAEKVPAIGDLGDSIFYSISLSMLHFTLDVLVHNQFGQSIDWHVIVFRALRALPILLLLLYLLHSQASLPVIQMLFLCMSVGAGCWLIKATNEAPYLAIMKKAPPLGAIWVWSVIELKLPVALASLVLCGAWTWWSGYSIL